MPARVRTLLVLGATTAVLPAPGLGQAAKPQLEAPLRVRSASLTQDAQQLVWRIEVAQPFAPALLQRDRRSLCLVIERARNATVAGVLCLQRARAGNRPALVYMPVTARGRGLGHSIAATLSRSSSHDLTARFLPASVRIGYAPLRWQVLSGVEPGACRLAHSGCQTWSPSQPQLTRLHAPHLIGCVPGGSPIVYGARTRRHVLALTFDDGPWPDTPQFLDVLERKHVRATFFQIGEQIGTYGRAVERRMIADGDMIGDHTWNHATVSGAGPFAAREIARAAGAISAGTGGFRPCLFRAPGGAISPALVAEARSMGFTTIGWDVDPRDWSRPGTEAIYRAVVGGAHNGAIVIQHDGGGNRSQTLAALPREIDTLRARGYRFVTITELLGQRLLYK